MFYPLINTITFVVTIFLNYYASSGKLTGKSVGELSDQYDSLFTPAGYAFSIWGLIYLLLTAFIIHQWREYFKDKKQNMSSVANTTHYKRFGVWFALSNVFNALWILAWTSEMIEISVFMMLSLLISLIVMVSRANMELWHAPFKVIAFVWWPIAIYLGWIVLATVANISAYLVSIRWDGAFLSPVDWTIVMMFIATLIYIGLIVKRNLRESALVGVWGLIAIAHERQVDEPKIYLTALILAAVLIMSSCIHAFKNRRTLPWIGKDWPPSQK